MNLPSRSSEARSRARNPNHDGTAQAVRQALARSTEPLSISGLNLATGIPVEKIKATVCQMVTAGTVVSLKGPKGAVYTLYDRLNKPAQESGSGRIAERITHGRGFRWGF